MSSAYWPGSRNPMSSDNVEAAVVNVKRERGGIEDLDAFRDLNVYKKRIDFDFRVLFYYPKVIPGPDRR